MSAARVANPVVQKAGMPNRENGSLTPEKRRANLRLAIALAVVAACFYVGMIFFNPLTR